MSDSTIIFLFLLTLTLFGVAGFFYLWRYSGPDYPSCGKCGYNLTGLIGGTPRCPECGADFGQVGIRPPRRHPFRRYVLVCGAIFAMLMLATAISAYQAAKHQRRAEEAMRAAMQQRQTAMQAQSSMQQAIAARRQIQTAASQPAGADDISADADKP